MCSVSLYCSQFRKYSQVDQKDCVFRIFADFKRGTLDPKKMVLLGPMNEFSTMCMNALDAFESINTWKGAVFDSWNCNDPRLSDDSRDEGMDAAAQLDDGRACAVEDATLRQSEPLDTVSASCGINPCIIRSEYNQRRHVKMDSFTTFLPYDDDDIFRSRQASQGSDSQCFRLCRLHRCTAFSQDSGGDSIPGIQPPKSDPSASNTSSSVRMVHWDELVEDSVVNVKVHE